MIVGDDGRPDLVRRSLLRRLGLAGAAVYTAPALTHLGMAHASGGSGGGGSGGGRGSGGGDRGGNPVARQTRQPRVTRRTAAPRTPPPPEIVLFLPQDAAITAAEQSGYTVQEAAPNAALGGTLFRLNLPRGRSLDDGVAELTALYPAGVAEENHFYTPDEFLCDGEGCDAHEMIGWSGWPSIHAPRIGMIDTGINARHPALEGQKLTVHQADLGGRDSAGRRHGTAIASMLIGRLEYRVPGLLPNAELIAVEAFHNGFFGEQADAFSLAGAIDILLTEGVSVINMSFSGPRNRLLEQMVRQALMADVAVVAAAGNKGPGAEPAYPAAFPEVVAVTAVDAQERIYRQANHGAHISFAAPGVRVWAAASISGGRLMSGTSYAVPFVTASLAVQRKRAPSVPLQEIIAEMAQCARDLGEAGHDPVFGHGLVAAPGQCFAKDEQLFPVAGE